MPSRVLWVEDDIRRLAPLLAAVRYDGRYEVDIARSYAEGKQRLAQQEYDAVIIDAHVPEGTTSNASSERDAPRGIALLEQLVAIGGAHAQATRRVAVFSVDSDSTLLAAVAVHGAIFARKSPLMEADALLQLLDRLFARSSPDGA